MATVAPWTEQWQHFLRDVREEFWGDLYQRTRVAWQRFLEAVSRQEQERYLGRAAYARAAGRPEYRNGYYARDFVPASARSGCGSPAPAPGPSGRRASRASSGGRPRWPC